MDAREKYIAFLEGRITSTDFNTDVNDTDIGILKNKLIGLLTTSGYTTADIRTACRLIDSENPINRPPGVIKR